jgi:predicted membrane protein
MTDRKTDTAVAQRGSSIQLLPLLAAIVIMLGVTIWPGALAAPGGGADHWAAMALFWAMSAGFVTGVGFRPRFFVWRWLFSGLACLAGVALAAIRLYTLG